MDDASKVTEWLSAARGGSVDALGQVLEVHRAYLLRIANEELADDLRAKGGASDLVQETFLEAHRDFGGFRGATESDFQAWLRGLLLHRVANFARHYRGTQKRGVGREVPLEGVAQAGSPGGTLPAGVLSPSGQAEAAEEAKALEAALARLPEDYRQVITLRYHQERSFEEIGQALGRSAEAVRKLWWRAIERLQREMDAPS
jgi:RNA polymerase sigma-70 factor (ECF subfamily)